MTRISHDVMVWVQNVSMGSCVWTCGHHLVNLFSFVKPWGGEVSLEKLSHWGWAWSSRAGSQLLVFYFLTADSVWLTDLSSYYHAISTVIDRPYPQHGGQKLVTLRWLPVRYLVTEIGNITNIPFFFSPVVLKQNKTKKQALSFQCLSSHYFQS